MISLFFATCNQTQEQKEKEEVNEPAIVDKEIIDEIPEKETIVLTDAENEVYEAALIFIKWYIENRDTLLNKRERIVGTDSENFATINLELLYDYLAFLKKEGSNCISTQFIESEKNYWQDVDKENKSKPIVWEDGPDPWSFDADPIFYGHDWPSTYQEWRDDWKGDIDKASININNNSATFLFSLKREMVKENGKWKMSGWFAEED